MYKRDLFHLLIFNIKYSLTFHQFCLFNQFIYLRLVIFPFHPAIYVLVFLLFPLNLPVNPLKLIIAIETGDKIRIIVTIPKINPLRLLQLPAYFEFERLQHQFLTKL